MDWKLVIRKPSRNNRVVVLMFFNECTINDTGDLVIDAEVQLEESGGRRIAGMVTAGALRAARAAAVRLLGSAGLVTSEEVRALSERIASLEEAV